MLWDSDEGFPNSSHDFNVTMFSRLYHSLPHSLYRISGEFLRIALKSKGLTALVGRAAVIRAVDGLAAGARLAALLAARHLAACARATLARVRARELIARQVHHVTQCAATYN